MDVLGGRKFVFAILCLIFSFGLVLYGVLPPEQWTSFVEVIGGTYVVGNVANALGSKWQEK